MTQYGMQTFDQSIMGLLREGLISEEEALKNANNPNELALKLKGIDASSDRTWQPVQGASLPADASPPGVALAAGAVPRNAAVTPPSEGFLN